MIETLHIRMSSLMLKLNSVDEPLQIIVRKSSSICSSGWEEKNQLFWIPWAKSSHPIPKQFPLCSSYVFACPNILYPVFVINKQIGWIIINVISTFSQDKSLQDLMPGGASCFRRSRGHLKSILIHFCS